MTVSRKRFWIPLLFLLLTLATQVFIFTNSMKNGEESGKQSAEVVEIVKPVYEEVLPALHVQPTNENITHYVRKTGHFVEFFLLGVLSLLTVWFFRPSGKARILFLSSPLLCGLTAMADEGIQILSEDRGPQWADVLLDFCGALTGAVLTLLIALLVRTLLNKRRKKRPTA